MEPVDRGPQGREEAFSPRQRSRSPCSPSPISTCVVQASKRWPAAASWTELVSPGARLILGVGPSSTPFDRCTSTRTRETGSAVVLTTVPVKVSLAASKRSSRRTPLRASRAVSASPYRIPDSPDSSPCSPSEPCSPSCSSARDPCSPSRSLPDSCSPATSLSCPGSGSSSDSRLDTCSVWGSVDGSEPTRSSETSGPLPHPEEQTRNTAAKTAPKEIRAPAHHR